MTFRYIQSTGEFYADGVLWGAGYSGHGAAKNDPSQQKVHNVGPLPCGWYTIGAAYDSVKTGPKTIILLPDITNDMFGRGGFRIHGDNAKHDASEGCIILSPAVREKIIQQKGARLEVIAAPIAVSAVQST